jgi:hypothetical protein
LDAAVVVVASAVAPLRVRVLIQDAVVGCKGAKLTLPAG